MENAMIPNNYHAWYHCITVDCKIQLHENYINQRITSLQDQKDFRTQQFIKLYGEDHRQRVIVWFQQALQSDVSITAKHG